MSQTVSIALITAATGLVGVLGGAVTSVFGPAWLDRHRRRAERLQRSEDLRFETARQFVQALLACSAHQDWDHRNRALVARSDFVATLRTGEGKVAIFTSEAIRIVRQVAKLHGVDRAAPIATVAGDQIFAWLRGENADLEPDSLEAM
jgi:hypothetical protein